SARTPDAAALVSGDRRVRYRELSERVELLAGLLRARGVGPEVVVGLFADPSPEMVVGMLAILRAGGACLPLGPATPKRRLAALLADARAPLVVTQKSLLPKLPEQSQPPVLLDELADEQGRRAAPEGGASSDARGRAGDEAGGHARRRASSAAYVIYVSDPEGKPRGV